MFKGIVTLASLIFLAALAWRVGSRLSPDALGMALGVLFGVLAGLPVALLVLASDRRRDREQHQELPPRPDYYTTYPRIVTVIHQGRAHTSQVARGEVIEGEWREGE